MLYLFTSTQEAVNYGRKIASSEFLDSELSDLMTERTFLLGKIKKIYEKPLLFDNDFQEISDLATQAQFLREAYEAAVEMRNDFDKHRD
jgi:hypothetical protein